MLAGSTSPGLLIPLFPKNILIFANKSVVAEKLPEISFEKHSQLNIEVFNFKELFHLLSHAPDHDPFSPHKIKFYLILIVVDKPYIHSVDFNSYEIRKGSVLFVAKDQVHQFDKSLHKSTGFAVVFSNVFVDEHYFLTDNFRLNRLFNYHIDSPVIRAEDIQGENISGLMSDLYQEFHSSSKFAKSEILASTLRLLLLKAERAKELFSVSKVNLHWLEKFNDFTKMLEKEYVNTRNSKIYAAKLFVSYKFLNEVVKRLTGKTVKVFIDDFVVIEIKRYLLSTSIPVSDISFKVGFKEPANMVSFFKKNTGATPLKFRNQL